jgi:tRNA uridine 5-carbamoylmethylation protein Kti12
MTGVEDVDINRETGSRFMGKVTRSKSVRKNMQTRYDQIVALTDEFCHRHLNDEYRDLAQSMAAALCRKRPIPVASGQVRSWACGIIYALGQVNFLSD